MSSKIFKEWFFQEFVTSTEKYLAKNNLPRKAILLLDNAPTHPSAEILQDGDIKAMFLPPNTTAICQPMDQGVLETLKRNYRRKLLSTLLEEADGEQDNVIGKLKSINVKDVAYWIARAWADVKASTIAKSWNKLLGENETVEDETSEDSILPMVQCIPGCEETTVEEVEDWMKEDDVYEITDEEIVDIVNNANKIIDDEAPINEPIKSVSHDDAVKALEVAMAYVEKQEEATGIDIMMLQRWRDLAAKKRRSSSKQMKITNFFSSS